MTITRYDFEESEVYGAKRDTPRPKRLYSERSYDRESPERRSRHSSKYYRDYSPKRSYERSRRKTYEMFKIS